MSTYSIICQTSPLAVEDLPEPVSPTRILRRDEIDALLQKERKIAKQRKTTTRLPKFRMEAPCSPST